MPLVHDPKTIKALEEMYIDKPNTNMGRPQKIYFVSWFQHQTQFSET